VSDPKRSAKINLMQITTLAVFGIGAAELLLIASILGTFGFWIWMLIDCATKEADQTQKILWLILIALVGFIGAPLYFFIRKLPRKPKTI
jgi:nitrate reductase NapE component